MIVNASDIINATLDGIVQFNITAKDEDSVKFEVINKPESATAIQNGNVLYFYWNVASSEKVHNFKQQSARMTQYNLLHNHSMSCHATLLWGGPLRDDPKKGCAAETRASVTKTKARVKVCEVLWFIVQTMLTG